MIRRWHHAGNNTNVAVEFHVLHHVLPPCAESALLTRVHLAHVQPCGKS